MEENKSKVDEENQKPLNIVLLGEESSEKEKLITKFLLSNTQQYSIIDNKKEEDKEEDHSLLQNIIHSVEMHGEKIKMKIWDNPSSAEFLLPSIKIAQGILLFYSIKNKKSFEKIKQDLSKIIELGKFDIPIVIIGNHSNSNNREVSYEEAKTFADNYGLRLYETSIESGVTINQILQDMGEQLLFQECINTANNSKINIDTEEDIFNIDDNLDLDDNLNIGELIESKNKNNYKSNKSNKNVANMENQDLIKSLNDSNIKKTKSNKHLTKFTLFSSNSTTNLKKNKKPIYLKNSKNIVNKSGSIILSEKKSNFLNFSNFNLLNKN